MKFGYKTGANGPAATGVRVIGCDAVPCELPRGSTVSMEMDFTTANEVTELRATVVATALGVTAPYDLPEDQANACLRLGEGSSCPLSANEDATYFMDMLVSILYPPVSLVIEVALVDQTGEVVSCFNIDAVVV